MSRETGSLQISNDRILHNREFRTYTPPAFVAFSEGQPSRSMDRWRDDSNVFEDNTDYLVGQYHANLVRETKTRLARFS